MNKLLKETRGKIKYTNLPDWMDCNCVCHEFEDNTGTQCPHCQPDKYELVQSK